MTIRVALNHLTRYRYDRPVALGPQVVRLRPAPHARTPVTGYSLRVSPDRHFVNWQQDPFGNYMARLVFPDKTRRFFVEVDLVADMTVVNPFDFFVESHAEVFPFEYEPWLARELGPYLEIEAIESRHRELVEGIDLTPQNTVSFLMNLNARLQREIRYVIRHEPGVQTPEETLTLASGSCRDSAWLLVQTLRHLGLAARFVSGYLIQLAPDVESLDGPSGPSSDFTDLHAWAEVYLPGAGWLGFDPTSGLMAGEGHIPLAATPQFQGAAPITGAVDECEVEFEFAMSVTRLHEDARVTKPYTASQWAHIDAIGKAVDARLAAGDVRLTMGGEPTFVSIDQPDAPEWNTEAVGAHKRERSIALLQRLQRRFAPGGLLHHGQGKWYPGESLPRWALSCYWRTDGEPLWTRPDLLADETAEHGHGPDDARRLVEGVARAVGITSQFAAPAFEDPAYFLLREQRLPINVDPLDSKLDDPEERDRLARVFSRGLAVPTGWVLPIQRQWWQGAPRWVTSEWKTRTERLLLLPGDSPMGLRLPLDSLTWEPADAREWTTVPDPLERRPPLPSRLAFPSRPGQAMESRVAPPFEGDPTEGGHGLPGIARTALCVQPRDGCLHVFMPPVSTLEDYLDLLIAVEEAADTAGLPVILEGYPPPRDPRLMHFSVTPDPGVIEVNIHPSASWSQLVETTRALYEEARLTRLGTEKFDLDGKHTGTGGGNHVVLGGATPADSPFLRRPDLLASVITYWNNHPALSYLFSGRFVGPTSQAPRVDEGRRDALYELSLAIGRVPPRGEPGPPWLTDRLFRHILVDLTGNTHRSEICIDKLYSPDSAAGRLGLVEFRGFEMPPHPEMSLAQQLLVRSLVAHFWSAPYRHALIEWGTALHDRFLLPHFAWSDIEDVVRDLRDAGFDWRSEWFAPHFEFRFPKIGELEVDDIHVELRAAIEPWYVLGEEPGASGTVRFVDSSMERLQVRARGLSLERYAIACNGRQLPLHPTGVSGEFVAGIRYRAWQPPSCLHPTIPVHTPLVVDVVDLWHGRAIAGCTYHVAHPAGRNYEVFPVNAFEAEARRAARFFCSGHTPGPTVLLREPVSSPFPLTLDLRRAVRTP